MTLLVVIAYAAMPKAKRSAEFAEAAQQSRSSGYPRQRLFWLRANQNDRKSISQSALVHREPLCLSRSVRSDAGVGSRDCNLNNIEPMEPIKMDETLLTNLGPPRFEIGGTPLIAGLGERYNGASCARGHPDLQTSPSRVRQHSLNIDRADAAAYCAPSISSAPRIAGGSRAQFHE